MPYRWLVTGGSPPPGTAVTPDITGTQAYLTGIPEKTGTYNWTVTVNDQSDPVQTVTANYSITVYSQLVFRGDYILTVPSTQARPSPNFIENQSIGTAYNNGLFIEELGRLNSTFTLSVIEGTKPAWLTLGIGTTVNQVYTFGPIYEYCYAPITFSGTPTEIGWFNFTIQATSVSGAKASIPVSIYVQDDGIIIGDDSPYYSLTASASEIQEGQSVTIKLNTIGQANGATIPYVITGSSGFINSDINIPLTGVFTLTKNIYFENIVDEIGGRVIGKIRYEEEEGSITIQAVADLLTEGTESFTISLPGVTPQSDWVTSVTVRIRDTSVAAPVPTYRLQSSTNSAQEGQNFSVTLTTTDVPQGTRIYWYTDGVWHGDLALWYGGPGNQPGQSQEGYFTIGADGTSTLWFSVFNNNIVDPKTFRLVIPTLPAPTGGIDNWGAGVPYNAALIPSDFDWVSYINLNPDLPQSAIDTRVEAERHYALFGYSEGRQYKAAGPGSPLSVSVAITDPASTYNLYASSPTIREGESVSFNLATTTVADGTVYAYAISGVSAQDINVPLSGSLTVRNNLAGITLTTSQDLTTEGTEVLYFTIPALGLVTQCAIQDTSTTPVTFDYSLALFKGDYSIGLNASQVLSEGDEFIIEVHGSAQAIGTSVRYEILGAPSGMMSVPLQGDINLKRTTFFGEPTAYAALRVRTQSVGDSNALRTITVRLRDYRDAVTGAEISSQFQLKSVPSLVAPTITQQPGSYSGPADGRTVNFSVGATINTGGLNYQWQVNLPPPGGTVNGVPASPGVWYDSFISGYNTPTIAVVIQSDQLQQQMGLNPMNGRKYRCVITSQYSGLQAISGDAVITTTTDPTGPTGGQPVVLYTSSIPTGFVGVSYSAQVYYSSGVGPMRWSVSGLPSGLYIVSDYDYNYGNTLNIAGSPQLSVITPPSGSPSWDVGIPYDASLIPADFYWVDYLYAPGNSDLLAAGLDTQTEAESHYARYGINEGRPYKRVESSTVTVTATDSAGVVGTIQFEIVVTSPPSGGGGGPGRGGLPGDPGDLEGLQLRF